MKGGGEQWMGGRLGVALTAHDYLNIDRDRKRRTREGANRRWPNY